MKLLALRSAFLFLFLLAGLTSRAQTLAPGGKSDSTQLDALSKKIDEQTAKIDALSQQILKLEHQISATRPGVMIGENSPAPAAAASTPEPVKPATANNAHVVAKGETLTSIAKMHKVTVEELQKFNHIENDRKLQIGQSLMVPPTSTSSPTPASPSPNE